MRVDLSSNHSLERNTKTSRVRPSIPVEIGHSGNDGHSIGGIGNGGGSERTSFGVSRRSHFGRSKTVEYSFVNRNEVQTRPAWPSECRTRDEDDVGPGISWPRRFTRSDQREEHGQGDSRHHEWDGPPCGLDIGCRGASGNVTALGERRVVVKYIMKAAM
jgi:hypothetical protein